MTTDLPRRAWSPADVADILDLPYQTVLAMIHTGQIGAFKAGRYYRIPDIELDRLLRAAARSINQ